jgi:hypothetical protein
MESTNPSAAAPAAGAASPAKPVFKLEPFVLKKKPAEDEEGGEGGEEGGDEPEAEADIVVTPIVKLVQVDVKTGEEDEEEVFKV